MSAQDQSPYCSQAVVSVRERAPDLNSVFLQVRIKDNDFRPGYYLTIEAKFKPRLN